MGSTRSVTEDLELRTAGQLMDWRGPSCLLIVEGYPAFECSPLAQRRLLKKLITRLCLHRPIIGIHIIIIIIGFIVFIICIIRFVIFVIIVILGGRH